MKESRTMGPIFHRGLSLPKRLVICIALALVLMVTDRRFQIVIVVRSGLATVLYPVQILLIKPIQWLENAGGYLGNVVDVRAAQNEMQQRLLQQSLLVNKATSLQAENDRLRALLKLNQNDYVNTGVAAEVIYIANDIYSRRVILNRGSSQDVVMGSPVVDADGLLGQVTRVYPLSSEVTLLTDKMQMTPVLDTRSSVFGVISGDSSGDYNGLKLKFVPIHADVKVGDVFATIGTDGVYPAGILVAKVTNVQIVLDEMFARIDCIPLAFVNGDKQVLVVKPTGTSDLLDDANGDAKSKESKTPAVAKAGKSSNEVNFGNPNKAASVEKDSKNINIDKGIDGSKEVAP